jgi:hypothetical protein
MSNYPVNIEVDPLERVARWRPLFNWLLVIPLHVWLGILFLGAAVVTVFGWFAIVFTGRLPESFGNYLTGVIRYYLRETAYLYGLTDRYPGFSTPAGYVDPGDYQCYFYAARAERRNRATVAFRIILFIPQYIVLYLLTIVASIVLFLAWFAVLFTGRWPQGLRNFTIGYLRWSLRAAAYILLVTDQYPPFRLEA